VVGDENSKSKLRRVVTWKDFSSFKSLRRRKEVENDQRTKFLCLRKFKGYQPIEGNLDVSKPPKSGSGVSSDKIMVVIKLENIERGRDELRDPLDKR